MGPSLLALVALLTRAPLALDAPRPDAPLVRVGEEALDPVFAQPPALATALATRDHATAVNELKKLGGAAVPGRALGDYSFLLAWSQVRAGKATDATGLLDAVAHAETTPAPYRSLVTAELLSAAGQPVKAAQALEGVPADARLWPRARLEAAEALFDAGSTAESRATYAALA